MSSNTSNVIETKLSRHRAQKPTGKDTVLSASRFMKGDNICSGFTESSEACQLTPAILADKKRSDAMPSKINEGIIRTDILLDITHKNVVKNRCKMRTISEKITHSPAFEDVTNGYRVTKLILAEHQLQRCNSKCKTAHKQSFKTKYLDLTSRNFWRQFPVSYKLFIYAIALLLILSHNSFVSAKSRTLRKRQPMYDPDFDVSEVTMPMFPNAGSNAGLYPSMVNLAAHARISANATCGQDGSEYFCKLVEHVHRISRRRRKRSQCDTCSSTDPRQRHDIEFAIDGRGDRWWQSPSINNGYKYHWVTITLDLKQIFQVAYVILKAGNSPRPGNWIMEKSLDGETWQPWHYFAVTGSECRRLYPARVTTTGSARLNYDSEVVCTPYFSQLLPLQNGEIHISMINGRPSAENPSKELIEFTSAQFIRLRFQKIRTLLADLMTIGNKPAEHVDPSVTRRYFYSVKDISIGGMCICHGHAHDCPSSLSTGKFVCKCEHNTMGDNCEQCLPNFNQYKWSPGNDGYHCEECNCHGHAESCYYDENVEWRKESINKQGIRKGGGVCIDCQDFTAGVNCDSCVDGYYRPLSAYPGDEKPCRPCACDVMGTRRSFDGKKMCRKTADDGGTHRGMLPGDCYCKEGYAGSKCNRCDFGYHDYPNCKPCPCNADGSLNMDPCHGPCLCKENVEGSKCDQCKHGYFNLNRQSHVGCENCYCSGLSATCDSAVLYRDAIREMRGWVIVDRPGAHKTIPEYDEDTNEPYVSHQETARDVCSGMYYWKPPHEYFGNKLSSYGGELRYTIYYELPMSMNQSSPIRDIDVILEGKDISIEFSRLREVPPFVSSPFVVPFQEGGGWIESNSQRPATKGQILRALNDVKRILIRASYNRNGNSIFRIRDVSMDIATPDGNGEPVSSVELCRCPPGYDGLSCETCATGYYRSGDQCRKCACNGHSDTCNMNTGVCENCSDGTTGIRCELCKVGYYGHANRGGCKMCACPLTVASNNFSPACAKDDFDDLVRCLNCPRGYEGPKCERCVDGYYGNPTVIGDYCRKCECNGNAVSCDKSTGTCIACQGHTTGSHCELCSNGYYGDAINQKDCRPCRCDVDGAISGRCDADTGSCTCRPGVTGRQCKTCQDKYYLDRKQRACVPCQCVVYGSKSDQCDATGQCTCKEGITGEKCNQCESGYFDFGVDGCKKCDCPQTNQHCDSMTGACICPPYTTGVRCSQCVKNAYGWNEDTGCKECNCHSVGSQFSQCNVESGDCLCKTEYSGKQCNLCRDGYHDFPNCMLCSCYQDGVEKNSCREGSDECTCSNAGQCVCKANVVGVKCNRCAEGTFSLEKENPKGCTDCFCSGVTNDCHQAEYHWGNTVSLSVGSQVKIANQVNTRSTSEGVLMSKHGGAASMDPSIVRRSMRYEPYYWRLPPQFNGAKLTSYGGYLRFTIFYAAQIGTSVHASSPTVVLRGRHNATTIAYKLEDPRNKESKKYEVRMRENGWVYLDTESPVSRDDFALVLSNIDFFLIKASYGDLMDQSRLSEVFLDVGVEGSGGRGDASSSGLPALGIEICNCPPGYTGLSCENCSPGYMRIRTGSFLGECRPCACNGKSDVCDVNTGVCLGCRDNFNGDRCEKCTPGYYISQGPSGQVCKKCACPLPTRENNFSPTCHANGLYNNYTCDACPTGYKGKHCERCAEGYYGDPTTPGSFCRKCSCNPSGSVNLRCNQTTGKCECKPGITGLVCDQCKPRHAITEDGCIACDDDCSGKLLDEIEALTKTTKAVKLDHIFPPPWNRIMKAENKTDDLMNFMDRKLTNVMDVNMIVIKVLPEAKRLNKTLNQMVEKSKMCYLNGDDVLYQVNKTHEKLKRKLGKIQGALDDSEEFTTRMKRLWNRLQDGTDIGSTEITIGIADLITQLRNRDLSKYEDIANEELRLANKLLSRVTGEFTNATHDVVDSYLKSKENVSEEISKTLKKLDDLEQKISIARNITKKVEKVNGANTQTIKQLKAVIEKLENDYIMLEMLLKAASNVTNMTELKIKLIKEHIESMKMGGKKLFELQIKLSDEANEVIGKLDYIDNIKMTFVERAEEHVRELVKLANYFEEVYKNISQVSFNQTDAATRYPRIYDLITKADNVSKEALKISEDASQLTKDNLSIMAIATLQKTMDLLTNVSGMKEQVKGDKQHLRKLKNDTRTYNMTTNDLRKDLKNIKKRIKNLNNDLSPTPDEVETLSNETNTISNEVLAKAKELQEKEDTLEKTVDIISSNIDIMEEIKDNLDSVPKLLEGTYDAINKAQVKKDGVEIKNKNVRKKIDDLRRQIEETRMKAASIRKASVKSDGKCTMRYLPRVTPGRVTEIVLQFMTEKDDNVLFYLGQDEGDFILVETINGKVQVTWDLGGGKGRVLNPVRIIKNSSMEIDWYKVELKRFDQEMTVTVFQMSNKDATSMTVSDSSPGAFTVLNVDERGFLFVGGITDSVKLPANVRIRSFTGCMGEAFLQGKSLGLWNFREVSDPSHCEGCRASPQEKPNAASTVYGYNGNSYTVLQESMSRREATQYTVLDLEFKSLSSNALLLYKGSSRTNDFASLELNDGFLIARVNLGNGEHVLKTKERYNTGKWIKTFFRRKEGKVQFSARKNREKNEVLRLQINGTDGHLNMTAQDLTCIGGCPADIVLANSVMKTGFIGCIKSLSVVGTVQPLAGSANNILRYSQVDTKCPPEVMRDIGIAKDGFVELTGHSLPATGSVSVTFNSREPDALLLLATDDATTRRRKRRRRQSNHNFYSLSLLGGHVEARIKSSSGSPLVLKSKLSLYSDGDEHTVMLIRKNEVIQLIVDEHVTNVVSGSLSKGGKNALQMSRMYIGGLPESLQIKNMAGTGSSLNGCIRELITDRLVNFNEAVSVSNSYMGTCAYTRTAPFYHPTPVEPVSTTTSPQMETRTIRSTTPSMTPSALWTVTIPPTISRVANTNGCAAQGELNTLKGSTVFFGKSAHSHMQFAFKDNIENKFRVQIEFRTFAPQGLLLFASSEDGSEYFSLKLKNGKPEFKCTRENATMGDVPLNDGKWHTVRISRSKRKGYIKVDGLKYNMHKAVQSVKKMGVANILYVGGIPENTIPPDITRTDMLKTREYKNKWLSLDSCVRSVTLNKKKLDLRKPDLSHNVGKCHEKVEEGAYFDGSGYAIYDPVHRVGPVMSISLELRTWSQDGVILSVSGKSNNDGLALEIVNGSVYFRVDNGGGNVATVYSPQLTPHNILLCDGNWHKIEATKAKNLLTLKVDGHAATDPGALLDTLISADTDAPIYIGGYPDDALKQSQLTTSRKFQGCIRGMRIKQKLVNFSLIHEYKNIFPNSCPKGKG